ncbi:MAG TPA: hypothetical protein QGF58_15030 [Myxococcota bacterium]|nr:hypothetical protein [Myxococcota bacterium]
MLPAARPEDLDGAHLEHAAELALALQASGAVVELVADSGVVASQLAAAAASHIDAPPVRASLAGCQDEHDVLRAIGFALDLPLPGDATAVGETLRRLGAPLVVLEDTVPEATVAFHTLRAMALGVRWLFTTAQPLGLGSAHPVEVVGRRGRSADPVVRGLLSAEPGEEYLVARSLCPHADGWLQLAWGATPRALVEHKDILLVRFLARHLPSPAERAVAAAAAVRMVAVSGQLPLARSLLDGARDPVLGSREQALLDWAGGDVLSAFGLHADATGWHRDAIDRFERLGEHELAAALLQGSGASLATRGLRDEAAERLRRARVHHRRAGTLMGLAAGLRGSAEIALARNEALAADAIFEQSTEILEDFQSIEGDLERAALRVGQASLALARGDLRSATTRLDEARDLAPGVPVLQAAVARRKADVALRRGHHDSAMDLLARAIPLLQRCGHRASAAGAIRLRGDIAAARGRRLEAAEHYELAVVEAVRVGDLSGARRTLSHLLTLERSGTDTAHVEDLLSLIDDIDTELGDNRRRDAIRL